MSEHFIKNIEIKNFKCFEDFKAEGFGRVNLIGGKNNVGKTAFMEAVYVNVHAQNINTLFTTIYLIKYMRDNLDFICKDCTGGKFDKQLFENTKSYFTISNINKINFNLLNRDGKKEYSFNINNKTIIINTNDFSYQIEYIPNIKYIDNFGFSNNNLKEIYIQVQRVDKENILNHYINEFDNTIEKFKVFDNSPECKLKNSTEYRRINEFGDGLKHYISIICSLYACENGYLFIDEIDNGIHYTQLDKLWKIILTLSKQQKVQVFATTHSKECIESYARVAKKLEDEEIAFIELCKREEEIKAFVYPYDWFIDEIEQEHEVRGCL